MARRAALIMMVIGLMCGWALAEGASVNVELGEDFTADLNGNGAQETFQWHYIDNDYGDETLSLTIYDADGAAVTYDTEISSAVALWLTDFRGPALVVTGYDPFDEMLTYALRYTPRGRVEEIMFNADSRGKLPEQYFTPYGTGIIAGMSGERIVLESYVDTLGTWLGQRGYALNENDRFVFDSGLWTTAARLTNPDVWDDQALTVSEELEYTNVDDEIEVLPAGTRLLVTATDKESIARFVTEEGVSGTLEITPREDDEEYDCLFYVNSVDENKVFESVRYE